MADKRKSLSNIEVEAMLLYVFVSTSMAIRGYAILTTSEASVVRSSFYSTMDKILPYNLWGVIFILAAAVILFSPISQTYRKYYFSIAGNVIGGTTALMMASIGFIESHQGFTPLQISSIAFFNIVLFLHGGTHLWKEKRRIHTLQE